MSRYNLISEKGFDQNKIINNGVKYIIGNGYLGYRGTLDEMKAEDNVGLNLPNFYDQVDDNWMDSVNAFNPLYTLCYVNDQELNIKTSKVKTHYQELNILSGVFTRKTRFLIGDINIDISSSRFASMNDYHYLGVSFGIKSSQDIKVKIVTGIDTVIWDLHGKHLVDVTYATGEINKISGYTSKKHEEVIVKEKVFLKPYLEKDICIEKKWYDQKLCNIFIIDLKKDEEYRFNKTCYVSYREKDNSNDLINYDMLLNNHLKKMKELWKMNKITLSGDLECSRGINYSVYQLMINAPRWANNLSIPARGLSSQVYKGAIFWDTEIFMLPYFLNTDLDVAKAIINYRIESLPEARKKAIEFGYQGAFYAWESVENGYDACSLYNVTDAKTQKPLRTYFKDKQIHISGDIIYALCEYFKRTEDYEIFINGGLEMLYEVCNFYLSYIEFDKFINKYVVNDVIGPDEYHERVNNNAYTNKLIYYCLDKCLIYTELMKSINNTLVQSVINKTNLDLEKMEYIKNNLFLYKTKNGVIEQFSGYFDLEDIYMSEFKKRIKSKYDYLGGKDGLATSTQVIKQADVITMLYLFRDDYNEKDFMNNFKYYEPRTEHGSSLSASMYSLVSILNNNSEFAYPFFLQSATIDLTGKAKEYAGGIYIGGSHMASSGGAYMSLIYGFCGQKINPITKELSFEPHLPKKINKVSFKVKHFNDVYKVEIIHNDVKMKKVIA